MPAQRRCHAAFRLPSVTPSDAGRAASSQSPRFAPLMTLSTDANVQARARAAAAAREVDRPSRGVHASVCKPSQSGFPHTQLATQAQLAALAEAEAELRRREASHASGHEATVRKGAVDVAPLPQPTAHGSIVDALREEGNAHMRAGNAQRALELYSEALRPAATGALVACAARLACDSCSLERVLLPSESRCQPPDDRARCRHVVL